MSKSKVHLAFHCKVYGRAISNITNTSASAIDHRNVVVKAQFLRETRSGLGFLNKLTFSIVISPFLKKDRN